MDIATLRMAKKDDARDYANILNKSWKDTYGEYISIDHIDDEFNVEKLVEGFSTFISCSDYEVYIIESNHKKVGVLIIGKSEEEYKVNMEETGEIRSFHIKKEYQGLGIGGLAIEFALNRLRELDYREVCVWVKEQNTKAINFYLKKGFQLTQYRCDQTVDGAPSIVLERQL